MNQPLHHGFGAGWSGDRWSTLVCRNAWDETHDVRTFQLAPAGGGSIPFEAGQFLTLRTGVEGKTVERCYTISSSAAVSETLAITVKRKPGGPMSGHLHDSLRPGARIDTFGPAGDFGPPQPAGKLLLVSGGSGITPMASMLATAADLGHDLDAVFLHAARTPDDLIFADLWPRLTRRLPRLRVVLAASRCDADWPGLRGRLDAATLLATVPDLAERTVLCCGPTGFMATVRQVTTDAGVPEERYLEESFDFGAQEMAPRPKTGTTHAVTLARSGRTFTVAPGLTILQAAREAGLPMASSCRQGKCGTCKSRKLSGTVSMAHQGGIRQREIDAGLILPCCSRPETDVVLDR